METVQISIRIPVALLGRLDDMAEKEGRTRTSMLIRLLMQVFS